MTATNHAAVGALIAVTIKEPFLALPLAFLSHFVLDTFPHFGYETSGFGYYLKHKLSWLVLSLDLSGVITIAILLFGQPWYVYAAALVAVSPDFVWLIRYLIGERGRNIIPVHTNFFDRFHKSIQRLERPWGIAVELPLAASLLILLGSMV